MKNVIATVLLSLLVTGSALAGQNDQEIGMVVQNPLDEIRDALSSTLEESGVPFSEAQVQAIALVMDVQRRASEELFGQVLDFSGGPPQGAQLDQALAGIAWMSEAFLSNLDDVLTPEQGEAWMRARVAGTVPENARLHEEGEGDESGRGGGGSSEQIAQIRINNNPYTTETLGAVGGRRRGGGGDGRDGGGRNEVITRGGVGDFHGNVNFTYQNHHLNQQNAFADNKPPYTRRNIDAGFNGPLVANRLTVGFSVNRNEEDTVNTVSAITPDGAVSVGVTQPNLTRRFSGNGQLQVSDRQAVHFTANYNGNRRNKQEVGEITLEERGRDGEFNFLTSNVRSLTQLSDRTVLDITVGYNRNTFRNQRNTQGVAVNVKDAFEGGGAGQQNETVGRTVSLKSILIRSGDRLTFKTGFDFSRLSDRSLTEDDFNGTFEFASLEDFVAGTPTKYTVNTGEPLLNMTQIEAAAFVQNDFRVSNRLMLMFGVRYQAQSNLDDWNDFDPRLGYAFAVSDSTVLRGGVGLFHNRLSSNTVKQLLRLDGARQQEIVVRNPFYPNPFVSGVTGLIPPSSIRVRAPDLGSRVIVRSQVSLQQTLPGNARATVSYDFERSTSEHRSVNLNAPRPGEIERPDPTQGNILELRSTGRGTKHELGVNLQQRLRTFTLSGDYRFTNEMDDSDGPFSLPSNNYDLAADWSRGDDRVHDFRGSVNAEVPLGIFLTFGVRARSGEPYTITTGRDDNGDTETSDRAPGVPRNSGTTPRFLSTDLNLSKVFFLRRSANASRAGGAGTQVNVFANITNVFNRTNIDRVSSTLTSSRFGQPIRADDPREIEVGLRFQF